MLFFLMDNLFRLFSDFFFVLIKSAIVDDCPFRHILVIFLRSKGKTFTLFIHCHTLPSGVVIEISTLTNHRILKK